MEMHPTDAAERGLADQQDVVVANDRAEIAVVVRLSDAVREGIVVLEGKWWDRPAETAAVANLLGGSRPTETGQPTYNDIFVRVMAATR